MLGRSEDQLPAPGAPLGVRLRLSHRNAREPRIQRFLTKTAGGEGGGCFGLRAPRPLGAHRGLEASGEGLDGATLLKESLPLRVCGARRVCESFCRQGKDVAWSVVFLGRRERSELTLRFLHRTGTKSINPRVPKCQVVSHTLGASSPAHHGQPELRFGNAWALAVSLCDAPCAAAAGEPSVSL